jgi:hypothetical protein
MVVKAFAGQKVVRIGSVVVIRSVAHITRVQSLHTKRS